MKQTTKTTATVDQDAFKAHSALLNFKTNPPAYARALSAALPVEFSGEDMNPSSLQHLSIGVYSVDSDSNSPIPFYIPAHQYKALLAAVEEILAGHLGLSLRVVAETK